MSFLFKGGEIIRFHGFFLGWFGGGRSSIGWSFGNCSTKRLEEMILYIYY